MTTHGNSRTARRRAIAVAVSVAAVLAVWVGLSPARADAQTPPTPPTSSTGSAPSPDETPTGCADSGGDLPLGTSTGCPTGSGDVNETLPDVPMSRLEREILEEVYEQGRNRRNAQPGGLRPLSAYDIGCDEGAWNHITRKVWCVAQSLPFAWGKWAIGVGIDVMGWALEFRLADALTPVAGLLSQVYDTSLVGPLGVRHLGWTLALLVAGWHLMRAHTARGIAEVATTFLVATVGAIVLANPQGYLEGSITLAQNSSGAVLEAVAGTMQNGTTEDQGIDGIRRHLGDILRRSFVAEPYDLINWGHPLRGRCADARDRILDEGPHGSDDLPRTVMRAAGCEAEADFNHDPTDSRAAASLIVGLASIVAALLLVAVALVVFVAQLTLVALFGGASLIWALALFPGGREVLWWWIGRLAWAVAATIAATFTLSWLAVTVTAVLTASRDMSIIQRSLVALLVVAFGFRLRAHLGRMIDQASRRFGASLNQLGRHAQNRWAGLAAGGTGMGAGRGGGGFGLSTAARDWSLDFPGGQYMWNRLYARHFTRGYRRSGYPGVTRRTLRRVDGAGQRLVDAGGTAGRTAGRAARAVVLAPVLGPQAYAATRVRASAASRRARSRLQQARGTRQQWVRNTRHPIQAMQDAHRQATPASGRRPPSRPATGRPGAPEPPASRRDSPAGWWAVGGTPYRQPGFDFPSRPVSYEQQQLDLDDGRSRRPRPGRGLESYEQPELDFGGWQQQFDFRPSERRRADERPDSPRRGRAPDEPGETPGDEVTR